MTPLAPTSPQITVDAYLKNPEIIRRDLTSLVSKRFVADKIFAKGSPQQVAGGVARYQQSESIYPDATGSDVEEIDSLRSEYPRFGWTEALQEAFVHDYGLEFVVSDKQRRRNQVDVIPRGIIKLGNAMVRAIDTLAMNTILGASGIQTMSASADWTTSTTLILKDLVRARKLVDTAEEGYVADTVVVHDDQWEDVCNNPDIRSAMPREQVNTFVQTGVMPNVLGFTFLRTSRLTAGTVLVLNARVFGTIADEEPSEGGWTADTPDDPSQAPIYTKQYRDEQHRDTIIAGARWPAMWVAEPKAVVKMTGA